MRFLNKMSCKTIAGKSVQSLIRDLKDGEEIKFADIYGQISGRESGESTYGPWVCYVGDFEARDSKGEIYRSQKLFLPEVGNSAFSTIDFGESGAKIEFAVSIGIRRVESLPIGYEYTFGTVFEVERGHDVLADMRAKVLALGHKPETTAKDETPAPSSPIPEAAPTPAPSTSKRK